MPDDPQVEAVPPESGTPPIATEIGSDVENVRQEIASAAGEVRDEAQAQLGQLKDAAQQQVSEATERAKSFATERKAEAADRLQSVSSAVRRVAEDLSEAEETAAIAGYVRDLAGSIDRFSGTIRGNSIDELVGMAQSFGRRQPLALLGAAAIAGFAASRLVIASAERRQTPTPDGIGNSATDGMDGMRNSEMGGALK